MRLPKMVEIASCFYPGQPLDKNLCSGLKKGLGVLSELNNHSSGEIAWEEQLLTQGRFLPDVTFQALLAQVCIILGRLANLGNLWIIDATHYDFSRYGRIS